MHVGAAASVVGDADLDPAVAAGNVHLDAAAACFTAFVIASLATK